MRLYVDLKTTTLATLLLLTTMGHGDGCCAHETEVLGPLTETPCPTTQTLTYENFGKTFVETYCTRCHSSQLAGAARNGAPDFHDFDTLPGIRAVATHIDQAAGSGPAATNTAMPPEGEDQPSLAEREMLAEWIACGAPSTP